MKTWKKKPTTLTTMMKKSITNITTMMTMMTMMMTKNMNMNIITTTIIMTTKAAKWKNTALALLFTTEDNHLIWCHLIILLQKWNKNIIRAKGLCYFNNEPDISYLFEQSGVQKKITDIGYWFCTASKEDLKEILDNNPDALRDWDDYYGDRMIKIVFIGQHMDIEQLTKELDACLTDLKL